MRLGRVLTRDGEVWLARIEDEAEIAVLISRESAHPAADALREALAGGVHLAGAGTEVPRDEVTLLAPVIRPSKILAIGLNYFDHAAETGATLPSKPLVFSKAPSSIVGPRDAIEFSASQSAEVDYEAELAVVIGRRAHGEIEDPLSHVFGYTVCNDVTARDAQRGDGQWVRGKSFDSFCPLGPWVVTRDELPDVQSCRLGTTIDGQSLQDGSTSDMIFPVEALIRYIARYITLEPGDVVSTGTPPGVGFARTPPRFLADGEQVTCWVEGIGELTNTVQIR